MRRRSRFWATAGLALALGVGTLPLAACETDGELEEAGEEMDEAVDDAEDAVEDLGD